MALLGREARCRQMQTNAAGQVVLKLKTAWRDGITHLIMRPLGFVKRLTGPVTRLYPATSPYFLGPRNGS